MGLPWGKLSPGWPIFDQPLTIRGFFWVFGTERPLLQTPDKGLRFTLGIEIIAPHAHKNPPAPCTAKARRETLNTLLAMRGEVRTADAREASWRFSRKNIRSKLTECT